MYKPNTTLVICPFCNKVIYSYNILETGAVEAIYVGEINCRIHLIEKHPIRRRLNRKIRKAFRSNVKGGS